MYIWKTPKLIYHLLLFKVKQSQKKKKNYEGLIQNTIKVTPNKAVITSSSVLIYIRNHKAHQTSCLINFSGRLPLYTRHHFLQIIKFGVIAEFAGLCKTIPVIFSISFRIN